MKQENYNCTITAAVTTKEAFKRISEVYNWWTSNFEGSAVDFGDEFTVRFGETFVAFKVTDVIPGKKIIWSVTDCYLHWLNDKHEWNGTKVDWEILTNKNATTISMTHVGLQPQIECYNDCEKGWNFYVGVSLLKLLNEGKGMPELRKQATEAAS